MGRAAHFNSEIWPGVQWWCDFHKRHAELSQCTADKLDHGRAKNSNKQVIQEYFELLETNKMARRRTRKKADKKGKCAPTANDDGPIPAAGTIPGQSDMSGRLGLCRKPTEKVLQAVALYPASQMMKRMMHASCVEELILRTTQDALLIRSHAVAVTAGIMRTALVTQ